MRPSIRWRAAGILPLSANKSRDNLTKDPILLHMGDLIPLTGRSPYPKSRTIPPALCQARQPIGATKVSSVVKRECKILPILLNQQPQWHSKRLSWGTKFPLHSPSQFVVLRKAMKVTTNHHSTELLSWNNIITCSELLDCGKNSPFILPLIYQLKCKGRQHKLRGTTNSNLNACDLMKSSKRVKTSLPILQARRILLRLLRQ